MTKYHVKSEKRDRFYERKFDYDRARELWEKGFNATEIARRLGNVASPAAIARACDPYVGKKMDEYAKAYQMSGTCVKCGGPRHRYTNRHPSESEMCRKCWSESRQRRFRLDSDGNVIEVRCGHCGEWKPVEQFGKGPGSRGIRGRCRACDTQARRDYRNRRKQPCVDCGQLAMHPKEKGHRANGFPLCKSCYFERMRAKMQTA
jgi:hypothetical protein